MREVIDFIQGRRHAVDTLIALLALQGDTDRPIKWGEIKKYFADHKIATIWNTFKVRRDEMEAIGLITTPHGKNRFQKQVKLTEQGRLVAEIVKEMTNKLKELEKS